MLRSCLRALTASLLAGVLLLPTATAAAASPSRGDVVERTVEQVVDTLGMPWGTVVNSWDLREAAKVLGIELREPPVPWGAARRFGIDAMDLWREVFVASAAPDLVRAHRQRLAEPARRMGLDPGQNVDDADVRRVAEALGLDVGGRIDPVDVHHVLVAARRRVGMPSARLATVGGVTLHVPGEDVRAIGFHEAPRGGQRRLAMTPLDARSFEMPSRGRGTPSTSAVDVAMPAGTDVLSPVDGVVTEVKHYRLYGRYHDAFIRIRVGRAEVVVLHVSGVKVRVGQRVEGGRTVLADGPRVFPFDSQVEEFVGRYPHVDVSVRPAR